MSAARNDYVVALLREREGYAKDAKADRIAAVDAELARYGIAVEDAAPEAAVAEPAAERAVSPRPARSPRKPRK